MVVYVSVTVTLDRTVFENLNIFMDFVKHYACVGGGYQLSYLKGWVKVKATGEYPKLMVPVHRPLGQLADIQMYTLLGIYFIPANRISALYLNFIERAPGDASTYYIGFYLSGATLSARSYPGSLSGTTSGSVPDNSVLITDLEIHNVGGTIYAAYGAWLYSWDGDSIGSPIVSAVSNVGSATGLHPVWYNCIAEANAATGVIGLAVYTMIPGRTGTSAPSGPSSGWANEALKIIRALRSLGLADPRTLDWS